MNHKKHYRITAFLFSILLIYSCAKDDSQKSFPENNQNVKFTTKRVYSVFLIKIIHKVIAQNLVQTTRIIF